MDSKTLAALKASIEHWRENEAALSVKAVSIGTQSCALCFEFFQADTCAGCPVYEATGQSRCELTPYDDAHDAYLDWLAAGYNNNWLWPPAFANHKFIEQWRAREKFLLAARDERQFLEGLLP